MCIGNDLRDELEFTNELIPKVRAWILDMLYREACANGSCRLTGLDE